MARGWPRFVKCGANVKQSLAELGKSGQIRRWLQRISTSSGPASGPLVLDQENVRPIPAGSAREPRNQIERPAPQGRRRCRSSGAPAHQSRVRRKTLRIGEIAPAEPRNGTVASVIIMAQQVLSVANVWGPCPRVGQLPRSDQLHTQVWPNLGQDWPRICQIHDKMSRPPPHAGRTRARTGQNRPKPAKFATRLANIAQIKRIRVKAQASRRSCPGGSTPENVRGRHPGARECTSGPSKTSPPSPPTTSSRPHLSPRQNPSAGGCV